MAVLASRRRERLAAASARFEAARAASLRAAAERIATRRETVERLAARATRALDTRIGSEAARLQAAAGLLAALSFRAVLGRGFALLRDDAGALIGSVAAVHPGARLEAEVADGRFAVTVAGDLTPEEARATPAPAAAVPVPAPEPARARRKPRPGAAPLADLFDH
jgi:exodeoxyribonuclease VII large subunit